MMMKHDTFKTKVECIVLKTVKTYRTVSFGLISLKLFAANFFKVSNKYKLSADKNIKFSMTVRRNGCPVKNNIY